MKSALTFISIVASISLVASPVRGLVSGQGNAFSDNTEKLPYDSVVEYIQTRGQQWIDTRYVPTSFPNLELRGACPYGSKIVLGMNSPINGFIIWVSNLNDSDGQLSWSDGKDSMVFKTTKYEPHKEFRLYTEGDKFVVFSHSTDSFTVDLSSNKQSIRLNHVHWGGQTSTRNTKIKWFKVWDGESLVMDLIPVRFTNSSGEIDGGLYDRVSGRLLKNQGTGTFVVGPDVVEE